MTEKELIKLKMYDELLQLLYSNKETISSIRAFSWSANKLRRITLEIRLREKDYFRNVIEKNFRAVQSRKQLIASILNFSNNLIFYAVSSGNAGLKGFKFLTEPALTRLADNELLARAELLISFTDDNGSIIPGNEPAAENYTEDLKAKYVNFRTAVDEKRTGPASPSYILAVTNLFAEADKLIRLYMDNFAEALAPEHPLFFAEYMKTRNIERSSAASIMR